MFSVINVFVMLTNFSVMIIKPLTLKNVKKRNTFSRKLNFSDASPDGQRGSEDISIGSGMSGIPGSPAMSSCSEGEPAHSPIENYLSPSSRSRSPILGSSHNTTQSDVDSLRLLLQEVFCVFIFCALQLECVSLFHSFI